MAETLICSAKDAGWVFREVKAGRSFGVSHIAVDPWYDGEPAVDEYGPAPEPPMMEKGK